MDNNKNNKLMDPMLISRRNAQLLQDAELTDEQLGGFMIALLSYQYRGKLPEDIDQRQIFVVDPMLATGGSAIAAIDFLKARGCKNIIMMNVIGCPEGVKAVQEAHPDVELYLAALDEKLNEHAYIIPGLGDAGDRIFGTK